MSLVLGFSPRRFSLFGAGCFRNRTQGIRIDPLRNHDPFDFYRRNLR
jgi:hypothetical protein